MQKKPTRYKVGENPRDIERTMVRSSHCEQITLPNDIHNQRKKQHGMNVLCLQLNHSKSGGARAKRRQQTQQNRITVSLARKTAF